jgi:hypothetical protein
MNKNVNIRIEIKDDTVRVHASMAPWPRCPEKIVIREGDILAYLKEEGIEASGILTSPATGYLANYSKKELLAGTWIFEKNVIKTKKVVAKPKKRSYNSSKKKTVSVTPEE